MRQRRQLLVAAVLAVLAIATATYIWLGTEPEWPMAWLDISTAILIALAGAIIGYALAYYGVLEIRISKPRRRG